MRALAAQNLRLTRGVWAAYTQAFPTTGLRIVDGPTARGRLERLAIDEKSALKLRARQALDRLQERK
jgi:hypothetical protein